MHRDQAKRLILRVQAVAGVIGIGAVAAAVVPVAAPGFEPARVPEPKVKAAVERAASVDLDVSRLGGVLESIAPPVTVVVKKDEPKIDVPPPPPPPPVWKYLGGLFMPERSLAIVVVNDKQRMLRVGDKVDQTELLAISEKQITIREGDSEKRIDLAPRQSGALRIVTGASSSAAGVSPQMQAEMAAQMATQAANQRAMQGRGGLTPEQAAARLKHFNRSPEESGRSDDKMARIERVDMMLKNGRVNDDQAAKMRDMIESGAGQGEVEGVIGPDGAKGLQQEDQPK